VRKNIVYSLKNTVEAVYVKLLLRQRGNKRSRIKDMKARRIGGLLGCPRILFLFGALDRDSTAQMK